MNQASEVRPRGALPREAGAEDEGPEVRRRKQAEREQDAAAFRATEAARRAALARRDAAEQRARAEAAEAMISRTRAELARVAGERDALLHSTSWKMTKPLRAAGQRLPTGLKGALRGGVGLALRAARLRPPARRQEHSG